MKSQYFDVAEPLQYRKFPHLRRYIGHTWTRVFPRVTLQCKLHWPGQRLMPLHIPWLYSVWKLPFMSSSYPLFVRSVQSLSVCVYCTQRICNRARRQGCLSIVLLLHVAFGWDRLQSRRCWCTVTDHSDVSSYGSLYTISSLCVCIYK